MDGVETVNKIRKLGGKYEDLAIIALTANAVNSVRDMFFENGFNDFIAKPVNVNELHEIVVKHLPPEKVFFSNTSDTQQDRSAKEDELFHKASVTFVKDNRETFINITGSLHSGDIKTAHRIAHTLKSSAGYLGKKALAEAALSLEDSLSSEPPVYTSEQLSTLENELNNALREFEPLLAEAEANKPKAAAVGKDKLAAILEGLRPLLENGDFSAANYVDELQCIAGMEKLAELIDDYDFEAALALLATLPDVCGCKDSTP
jgi:HPt (histidine-containing phosphotransfer) domain-containing protein